MQEEHVDERPRGDWRNLITLSGVERLCEGGVGWVVEGPRAHMILLLLLLLLLQCLPVIKDTWWATPLPGEGRAVSRGLGEVSGCETVTTLS